MKRVLPIIWLVLAVLVLGSFARAPYMWTTALCDNSVKNLNIAHNLLANRGMTLSIKWTYYPESPIFRPSIGEEGVVFPHMVAWALRNRISLIAMNLSLSLLGVILFFIILRRVFSPMAAWLSVIWLIFNPAFCEMGAFLNNSALLFLTVMVAGLILTRYDSIYSRVLAGLVLGLAFWIEPWFIFSGIAFLPGIALASKNRSKALANVLAFTVAFIVTCAPLVYLIHGVRGQLLPIHIPVHFQVGDYQEFLGQSYGAGPPPVGEFIAGNRGYIAGRILGNLGYYLREALTARGGWFFLMGGLGFLVWPWKAFEKFPRQYLPLLGFSVLSLAGASLVWSRVWQMGAPVFMSVFIMPLLFHLTSKTRLQGYPVGLIILALLAAPGINRYVAHSHLVNREIIQNADIDRMTQPGNAREEWVAGNKDNIRRVAASSPWRIYMLTRADTGLLPVDISTADLQKLVKDYDYDYIINNSVTPEGAQFYLRMISRPVAGLEMIRQNIWKVIK